MKKYIIYIGILVIGLLLGKIFFGGSSHTEVEHKHNAQTETNEMWTCSMHPQIMQTEPGACPICGMDLIPVKSNNEGLLADQFQLSENALALANIQTSIVGKTLTNEGTGFILSGKITENENETATMPAHFDGRIEKLYVNSLGEHVKKGQAIAQIYSPELIAAQQELITTYKLRTSQPQLYNAVKNKFKNWMIHDAQLNTIEQTGKVKTQFTIYSHVSGVVTEILINEGSHIMDGKPIFKVSNLKTVWANFDVFENQISQFKKGQDIIVTTNAYPNKEFKGKVDFIDPILDTKTRTVKLRVELNNKEDLFKPGMFVEGKVKGVSSLNNEHVLTIPSSSVLWTGKRSVVYLKANPKQPVFEMREIELGNQIGSNYQVLEGLNNGDEIVTNGTFTIDAEAQLQGKKSMMNKEGGKTTTGHEGHLKMMVNASENEKPIIKNERLKVPREFQNQLKKVFESYIKLKDGLVDENSIKIIEGSNNLLVNLTQVNMKLLNNNAHNYWMTLEKEIIASTTSISKTSDIKMQRSYFKYLSENLTIAVNLFGVNEKIYNQFCPMADKNKGAYWLSKEKEIFNPYFGDAMLKCGEVKQIIE
ncbi:efflux RND transporter periplasmic adaptor subunit [Lutibacter citreus]|uniref:efflux RND transporter periplasmic adaptor subunit n=1 Tax=Lutibacter citreus TaxID=2138210 RepID=UPI000DBE48E9|nr:efflux RND transporter periplasmic adaptor subunit [Lutibacter citreus]